MSTRPVLHEAENEVKTHEAKATKVLEAVLASRT